MNKKDIAVALVDDHSLFLEGLSSVLTGVPGIKIILKAVNGQDLITKLKDKKPQVVLMDLQMPIMDGIKATEHLRKHRPEIKVLGISMLIERRFIIEMIKAGAHGYLSKNTSADELRIAIVNVEEQGYHVNKNLTKAMYKGWSTQRTSKSEPVGITFSVREDQIIEMLCKQMTTANMAKRLKLSPRTVENYRQRLIEKTGVKNMAGLVMYAVVNGLVQLDLELKH
ncbi:MAG: response regulator transcription factor [Flavobacteriales bacterium]|nr:response regulator transcription factor [Flavobacteriales bacterium]